MSQFDYPEALNQLALSKPLLADALLKAEQHRQARLEQYISGVRLAGLEQLYEYLDRAYMAYSDANNPVTLKGGLVVDLRKIAFLVKRVKEDFQTALEATFSGYPAVASDMMRDVMETEALLLVLRTTPANIEEWLGADRRTLINKFGPGKVRDRLKAAGVSPWADEGFVAVDYQAHSQSLHVSPHTLPLAKRGPAEGSGDMFDDIPFMEMFENGKRVMYAIELVRVVALGLDEARYEQLADREAFDNAYQRTREMQFMVTTIISAPIEVASDLGRRGTPEEVRQHVAKKFRSFADALAAAQDDSDAERD